jgi:hypothetical protein
MGLKLTILCWWTPKWVISRELDHVSQATTTALKSLLATYVPKSQTQSIAQKSQRLKTAEQKRASMALEHTELLEALAKAIGREEALRRGRDALFELGKQLGVETRVRLGVDSDPKDLIKAATILYRVLGIDFKVELSKKTRATLIVDRCALSPHYSEFTCKVLSATDEGVVKGLNPNANMSFKEVLTSGCKNCIAQIEFEN